MSSGKKSRKNIEETKTQKTLKIKIGRKTTNLETLINEILYYSNVNTGLASFKNDELSFGIFNEVPKETLDQIRELDGVDSVDLTDSNMNALRR